jgi:hypothetical protein
MRHEARVGHPSPAAPSCRRADATELESLPERIGELRSLKHLCVSARRVHFTTPCVPRCGAGSSTGATLKSSPIRSATSISQACTRGFPMPVAFGIQSVQSARAPQGRVEECPPRATGVRVQHGQPDVAVRAVIILEACVAAPSARCCCRNAEKQRDELQALPDLACSRTLLYVCVPPLRYCWSRAFTEGRRVRGRLVSHNRLKDLPGLPRTLQRLCVAEPCRTLVRVPRTRGGSALGWLDLAHVQRGVEQRHHQVRPFQKRRK